MNKRGVITLAFGAQKYIDMASSLARSLIVHSPETPRAVITDSADAELRALYTHIVDYRPEFGSDVLHKLHLDLYSPFSETLFIDSDCLVVGNLDIFWGAFEGKYFAVQGLRTLLAGEMDPFLDVEFLLQHFALKGIPKFNGGIYYFNRSPQAEQFFTTVRMLLRDSSSLRFSSFRRDAPNDEAIYSTAMAIHKLEPVDLGRRGMWTPTNVKGSMRVDVLNGHCFFSKYVGSERSLRFVEPDIVHFAGRFSNGLTYRRECLKLRKAESRVDGRGHLTPADKFMLIYETLAAKVDAIKRHVEMRLKDSGSRLDRKATLGV
jgi:hypothetical protein